MGGMVIACKRRSRRRQIEAGDGGREVAPGAVGIEWGVGTMRGRSELEMDHGVSWG